MPAASASAWPNSVIRAIRPVERFIKTSGPVSVHGPRARPCLCPRSRTCTRPWSWVTASVKSLFVFAPKFQNEGRPLGTIHYTYDFCSFSEVRKLENFSWWPNKEVVKAEAVRRHSSNELGRA